MRVFDLLLKRDLVGGYPRWWQWFVPRYGAWGGPGWSGWRWNPRYTDWAYPAQDAMDVGFRHHDYAYQTGGSRRNADAELSRYLRRLRLPGLYPRCYRLAAIVIFWLLSVLRNEEDCHG